MLKRLWKRTKEVASLYTGTFIVVMFLNQLLFFGLCLNPVCLVAAMPHVLFITVVVGTWINKKTSKYRAENQAQKAEIDLFKESLNKDVEKILAEHQKKTQVKDEPTQINSPQESKLNSGQKSVQKTAVETVPVVKKSNANIPKERNISSTIPKKLSSEQSTQQRTQVTQEKSVVSSDKSIVVILTPLHYLDIKGQNKRKSITKTPIDSSRLSIEHDIHNPYDPLAIRVLFDRVFIGYIRKNGITVSVDKFCFDIFELKTTLSIHWDGSNFIISNVEQISQQRSNPLAHFGMQSIWHMSHIENVRSILIGGILSNTTAYSKFAPVDISNQSVQTWRTKKEPLKGRRIHDYAPTYLSIRNPMLFAKKNISSELCLFEIDPRVMEQKESLFTDGNAASHDTQFFNQLADLKLLPWDVLNSEYWNEFVDGKRKKCAEVLIYPSIDIEYIKAVHCSNYLTKQTIEQNVRGSSIPVIVSQKLFF